MDPELLVEFRGQSPLKVKAFHTKVGPKVEDLNEKNCL